MQIFKQQLSIDFMGKRNLALIMSLILLIVAIAAISTRGLNLGVDFTGGTLVEVGYKKAVAPVAVREALFKAGFSDAIVQSYGTAHEVLIRLAPRADLSSAEISSQILQALQSSFPDQVEMRRIEFVGPQIGDELREEGGMAMLAALTCIFIYVWLRFEKRFSLGSVLALAHDVIITIGFFSLFQIEFDLSVLAAVLAVIGYSLNDTIVVFDRIRENFRKMRKGAPAEVINISINQTLYRTMMTSMTTLLVLLALFFLGGEIIHGFATALIVGVLIGTYSSIYVASSLVLILGVSKADLMPVEKEGGELDVQP